MRIKFSRLPARMSFVCLLFIFTCTHLMFAPRILAQQGISHRWDFESPAKTQGEVVGDVRFGQPGPTSPEFPNFSTTNKAVQLGGKGARIEIADRVGKDAFDFTNGDAITMEAWVRIPKLQNGSPMYVIGKGRTGAKGFSRDNQNWSLRIVGANDVAKISFLFATAPGAGDSHWHRWTSKLGFQASSGWRHIAVAYRFGQPASLRCWIDGQLSSGAWDLGGPTTKPPIVDDAPVWIGSSQGGQANNSFVGWLDSVAVHRALLSDKQISEHAQRVGGPKVVGPLDERMPDLGAIQKGKTLLTIGEGMPSEKRWLNQGESWPREFVRWEGREFLLPRIPLRFDEQGIRADWKAPLLLRIAADIELAPGQHRFLLRARALGRLWVDGVIVARTKPIVKQPPNGEEPITPLRQPLAPGVRLPGYHQQEVIADIEVGAESGIKAGVRRVVLELVVGGKNLRSETGEVVVAFLPPGRVSYSVLRPEGLRTLSLLNVECAPQIARIENELALLDDQTRRRAAATQDTFWRRRHDVAKAWSKKNSVAPPPTGDRHPIDAFLEAKIARARLESAKTNPSASRKFHSNVLPILREHCFRCHGEKNKGGLKLDSLKMAVAGGDSGASAIEPGDAESSELIVRIMSQDESLRMPPSGARLSESQIATLTGWINAGAIWPAPPLSEEQVAAPSQISDESFLRRIYLDVVGVPPSLEESRAFLIDSGPQRRERLIEKLLTDERAADHWMSFWLDLLAENPTLLNASLNSTGPFRWFLYDSLRDNKPLDRMVTELIQMRGSTHGGGSAGFALAAENDAPMAAKGHILASAFLGIQLQCARCHDSPYHSTTQEDLYSLAAMLTRKPIKIPATSSVPKAFFEKQTRDSLIRVTLPPGKPVEAAWPFSEQTGVVDEERVAALAQKASDSRERLAALITAPWNKRFAKVMVNRIWKRLIGAGIVEPVDDWEGRTASHPALLAWLADQLIANQYDGRHVIRLIVTSEVYRREASGRNLSARPEQRFFNAPQRRRLTAEQIVDSLLAATGAPMNVEELTFVHDGRRAISNRLTLGRPTRAWMFASLNNERDRPSLSLPRARAVADVLQAFGWTGSRQMPITNRDTEPNILQPGVLANGILSLTATRAANGSRLAELAVQAKTPEQLLDDLFLQILVRHPRTDERAAFIAVLREGFGERLTPTDLVQTPPAPPRLPLVTWFNHQRHEANKIQLEMERRVAKGPLPDPRLRKVWREALEDVVWSLVNHREFVWMP